MPLRRRLRSHKARRLLRLFAKGLGWGRDIAPLLIGNQSYASAVGPLKNPKNDITVIKSALLKIGFPEANIAVDPDTGRVAIANLNSVPSGPGRRRLGMSDGTVGGSTKG